MNQFTLHLGDCLTTLRGMADNSVDAVVTDPPYGLSFMGKKWDYDVPGVDVWTECLRVLKPGGHLLAFAGTRTQHRMAVRIEDAGFEIRDMIFWCYGSGFPKSLDVSKAIDKAAGAEREVVGSHTKAGDIKGGRLHAKSNEAGVVTEILRTAPATEAAKQWQGWGTALKPALEPITVARKPFASTVAANVLQWGTGALNIDGCRVVGADKPTPFGNPTQAEGWRLNKRETDWQPSDIGRWPANLILSDCPEVVAGFPVSGGGSFRVTGENEGRSDESQYRMKPTSGTVRSMGDTGSAARFFYCAKASRADRDAGLSEFDAKYAARENGFSDKLSDTKNPRANVHPTVKPTDLMAYLVRLVTPPGGVVLDPFMGSGSTGKACMREGFRFIGCEMDPEYLEIARARIQHELDLIEAARLATMPAPIPQLDLFTS